MLTGSRRTWTIYAACVAAVVGVLGWSTLTLLRLEQAEFDARRQADLQERIRLALWRMESILAARLAEESGRPYFHYAPFYAPHRAYTRLLMPVETGEVLVPSPLLTYSDPFVKLHFQVDPDGILTSPQAPAGDLRTEAETRYTTPEAVERHNEMLAHLRDMLGLEHSDAGTALVNIEQQQSFDRLLQQKVKQIAGSKGQRAQTVHEYGSRLLNTQLLQKAVIARNQGLQAPARQAEAAWQDDGPDEGGGVRVGPFVVQWKQDGAAPALLLVRTVHVRGRKFTQGLWADWAAIRSTLLEAVSDLLPEADLQPATDPVAADPGLMLASIPALLSPGLCEAATLPLFTPMRGIVGLSWLVATAAIITIGVVLRAAVDLSRRRGEFVSAVTHELRTPLTTFRMYCEMLAEGMVTDERAKGEYLATLQDEADHLSRVVENVLTYARIEQGRSTAARRDRMTVRELIDQATARAAQRARRSGVELSTDLGGPDDHVADATVVTDPSAVEQILLNLIDNAVKYGAAHRPRVDVKVARTDGALRISISDNGRGIPPREAERIFQPFTRGSSSHAAGGTVASVHQGVGLGLAISRRLARDLGGDLLLDRAGGPGATFVLTLPA